MKLKNHFGLKPIKKIVLTLLVVCVTVFSISTNLFTGAYKSSNNEIIRTSVFENTFFNTNLEEPDDVQAIDTVYKMSDLYAYLFSQMGSENFENQIKTWNQTQLNNFDQAMVAGINQRVPEGTKVSISSADELFQFGNAQSINFNRDGDTNTHMFKATIQKVLSLDYILLSNIDYSVKRAQKFVPIGTSILLKSGSLDNADDIIHYMPFTGTFDGNGFTISNLYLADYAYITTTFTDVDQ